MKRTRKRSLRRSESAIRWYKRKLRSSRKWASTSTASVRLGRRSRRLRAEAERLAAENREAEIEEAEAAGATQEEVAVLAQAPLQVAPVMRSAAPKMAGISQRELWRGEVTDLYALVRFVAENRQYLNLIQANTAAVGAMARTLRSAMNIPGVRVLREANIATRGRA
jgi:hypothetical protein